jgi:hypothetical protein
MMSKQMSELSKQIQEFQARLCTVVALRRSKADHDIIELSGFVLNLSRKIDNLVNDEGTTGLTASLVKS